MQLHFLSLFLFLFFITGEVRGFGLPGEVQGLRPAVTVTVFKTKTATKTVVSTSFITAIKTATVTKTSVSVSVSVIEDPAITVTATETVTNVSSVTAAPVTVTLDPVIMTSILDPVTTTESVTETVTLDPLTTTETVTKTKIKTETVTESLTSTETEVKKETVTVTQPLTLTMTTSQPTTVITTLNRTITLLQNLTLATTVLEFTTASATETATVTTILTPIIAPIVTDPADPADPTISSVENVTFSILPIPTTSVASEAKCTPVTSTMDFSSLPTGAPPSRYKSFSIPSKCYSIFNSRALTPVNVLYSKPSSSPDAITYIPGTNQGPTFGLQGLRLSTGDLTGKQITGIVKGLRKDGLWIVKSISLESHGGWKNLKDFDQQWRSGLVAISFSATKDGKPTDVYVDSMAWSSDCEDKDEKEKEKYKKGKRSGFFF
ncbi:hypothetical protein RUND412_010458 [Rhizina undulata]